MAEPHLLPRDGSSLNSILSSIFTAMTNADAQLEAYNGGPPIALRGAAKDLVDTIAQNIPVAQGLAPLTQEDALSIAGISQQVTAAGDKFLQDLVAAVPRFEANGLCQYLYEYTGNLTQVAGQFSEAAGSKFPDEYQGKAAEESARTQQQFVEVQQAFTPGVCVDHDVGYDAGDHMRSGNGTSPIIPIENAAPLASVSGGALMLVMATVLLL
ncbi:hypothetical protein F5Y19DRAFT_433565 [Xylariaceae sp. FL1651]|nr:hypothetical protein F5Y19DRAFT_433565 [Xylariaceae sp. FL1651]